VRDPVGEELECDEPVEPEVLGLVDDTHATAAENVMKTIVRDRSFAHRRPGL